MPTEHRTLTQAWLAFCAALPTVEVEQVRLQLGAEYLLKNFTELNEGNNSLPLALYYRRKSGTSGGDAVISLAVKHLAPARVSPLLCGTPAGWTECHLIFSRAAVRELLGDLALASADLLCEARRKLNAAMLSQAEHDQHAVAAARATAEGQALQRKLAESGDRLKTLTTGASLPQLTHGSAV